MIVFWRNEPLSDIENLLLEAVNGAHRQCAMRNNASTQAVRNAAGGSGSLECALASALLTLGSRHAPIAQIHRFLSTAESALGEEVSRRLKSKQRIPGWGSSFFRHLPDPDWEHVREVLRSFPEMDSKIKTVDHELRGMHGRMLYPNAGCYTAATAIILRMPAEVASYILIHARLPVWAAMAQKEI